MNIAVAKAHVPCAEQNNRTIQEHVCETSQIALHTFTTHFGKNIW